MIKLSKFIQQLEYILEEQGDIYVSAYVGGHDSEPSEDLIGNSQIQPADISDIRDFNLKAEVGDPILWLGEFG